MVPETEDLIDPLLQKLLNGEGVRPIQTDFPTWLKNYAVTPDTDFSGVNPLREAFIPKSALDNIMNQTSGNFAGIVLYQAIVEMPDRYDPSKKIKVATLGAVAVDDVGRAYNAQNQGEFEVTLPCPQYCPKWR